MKKVTGVILAAMVLLLGSVLPGHAWGGYGGHHGYGYHGYGGHYGFGYGHYGYGYGYPYYSYSVPVVIQQEPQVYVQQDPQPYWYYCENAKAYYPYVQQCPNGWIKVVPPTSAPGQ